MQPRSIFKETLINNSLEKEFEEAMNEWVCVGEISRIDFSFCSHCNLCGAALYEKNSYWKDVFYRRN